MKLKQLLSMGLVVSMLVQSVPAFSETNSTSFVPDAKSQTNMEERKARAKTVDQDAIKFKTDSYIIRYKDESEVGKSKSRGRNKIRNRSHLGTLKNFEVVTLDNSVLPEDAVSQLKDGDIEYIMPDYEFELSEYEPSNEGNSSDVGFDNLQDNTSNHEAENPLDNIAPDNVSPADGVEATETSVAVEPSTDINQPEPTDEANPIGHPDETILPDETLAPDETTVPDEQKNLTESNEIIVAVIDTGIDITNSELAPSIWTNPNELEDGNDADANSFVGDIHGYNFIDKNGIVNNPQWGIDRAHGTHIAGIIAGKSSADPLLRLNENNIKIMPLRVFSEGKASTSKIIEAIEYAKKMNVSVINCSFGSGENNIALKEAIENAPEILFVCAAGNGRVNLDETPIYPAAYDLPNVISVTSANVDGGLSYFSNFGQNSVDIAACGKEIESTFPNNERGTITGTSMSAAVVTGAAALIKSNNKSFDANEIKSALVQGSDKISPLSQYVNQSSKLNIADSLNGEIKNDIANVNAKDEFTPNTNQDVSKEMTLFNATKTIKISSSNTHTLALKSDGTVWAWGNNTYGQLGNGTYEDDLIPRQMMGVDSIRDVSAGDGFSIMRQGGGRVWSCGRSNYGQLGINTTSNRNIPMQIPGLNNIEYISAGRNHVLAVNNVDGHIYSWGYNGADYSTLGIGTSTTSYKAYPVEISFPPHVYIDKLSAGDGVSFALERVTHKVWSWGSGYGLGQGEQVLKSNVPRMIKFSDNNSGECKDIFASNYTNFVVTSSGAVYGCGDTDYEVTLGWYLYDNYDAWGNIKPYYHTFVPVSKRLCPEGTDVKSLDCSLEYATCLGTDGKLTLVGDPGFAPYPETFQSITGVTSVSAAKDDFLYSKNDGTMWGIGFNFYGQVGVGSRDVVYEWAKVGKAISRTVKVSEGKNHHMLLKADGTVWTWGNNSNGQLGLGDKNDRQTPCEVPVSYIVDIAAGTNYSMAVDEFGAVWAWGSNGYGQLGDGTWVDNTEPVRVALPYTARIKSISAGDRHVMALTQDNEAWIWGANDKNQLGTNESDAAKSNRNIPIRIANLTSIKQVSAGIDHSVLLKTDGTLYTWGDNTYGQLGNGSTATVRKPVSIENIGRDAYVSAGGYHTIVMASEDLLRGCGKADDGQLGAAYTTSQTRLVPISLPKMGYTMPIKAKKIDAGAYYTCLVDSRGELYGFGNPDPSSAIQMKYVGKKIDIGTVQEISAGYSSQIALMGDKTIYELGRDGRQIPEIVLDDYDTETSSPYFSLAGTVVDRRGIQSIAYKIQNENNGVIFDEVLYSGEEYDKQTRYDFDSGKLELKGGHNAITLIVTNFEDETYEKSIDINYLKQ